MVPEVDVEHPAGGDDEPLEALWALLALVGRERQVHDAVGRVRVEERQLDPGVDEGRPAGEVPVRVSPTSRMASPTVPYRPTISCSTATPPASTSTIAPIQGVPPGTTSATTVRDSAGTVTGTSGGAPGWAPGVTTAAAGARPLLAMITVPGACRGSCPSSVAPAQNHEDDSASVGAATGTGCTAGPAGEAALEADTRSIRPPTIKAADHDREDRGPGDRAARCDGLGAQTSTQTSSPWRSLAPIGAAPRRRPVRRPRTLNGANHSGRTVSAGAPSPRRRRRSMRQYAIAAPHSPIATTWAVRSGAETGAMKSTGRCPEPRGQGEAHGPTEGRVGLHRRPAAPHPPGRFPGGGDINGRAGRRQAGGTPAGPGTTAVAVR